MARTGNFPRGDMMHGRHWQQLEQAAHLDAKRWMTLRRQGFRDPIHLGSDSVLPVLAALGAPG